MENDALKPEPTYKNKSVKCTTCYYNCIVGQTYSTYRFTLCAV